MRPPGAFGNATTIPTFSPTPLSSSVPWVETWWGLPLQWAAGMQLTLVMRIVVTWALEVPVTAVRDAGVLGAPVGAVPPELTAPAGAAALPASAHSSRAASAAVRDLDRL